jgi:hypothetical protein
MRALIVLLKGSGTIADLAKKIGVSVRAVSYWQAGREPTRASWLSIMAAFPGYRQAILAVRFRRLRDEGGVKDEAS